MRALTAVADELRPSRPGARAGDPDPAAGAARRGRGDRADHELARRPGEARERLLDALDDAIARLGGEAEADRGESNGHVRRPSQRTSSRAWSRSRSGRSRTSRSWSASRTRRAGSAATSEISVKRFAKGRATIEMKLGEPVELLRELEERAPFEFSVRDTREDRVVLDVDGD